MTPRPETPREIATRIAEALARDGALGQGTTEQRRKVSAAIQAALVEASRKGAEDERAAVAAFFRSASKYAVGAAADTIERGEHLRALPLDVAGEEERG